jgi:thiamine-phosphate pyrophosphorylase
VTLRLPPRPFLYPIVDVGLLSGTVADAVAALGRAGARLVQLRAKGVADARLVALAREAAAAARAAGVMFIVNDRADVARIVGADGVHVGQDDLAPAEVRPILPGGAIVGFSTHDIAQVRAAEAQAPDYVAVGPVFETRTKSDPDPVVGLEMVRAARAATRRPLVAIGGISLENASSVIAAGADGVAMISGLLRAADLEAAAREVRAALEAGM